MYLSAGGYVCMYLFSISKQQKFTIRFNTLK